MAFLLGIRVFVYIRYYVVHLDRFLVLLNLVSSEDRFEILLPIMSGIFCLILGGWLEFKLT